MKFEDRLLSKRNRDFITEIYVPVGLVLTLIITCWIASR